MNDAILNADLPMSLRLKRANRRGWRIDRPDNIRFLVEGAKAYRQLAAKQPWESTFEYNRVQPAGSFGDSATGAMVSGSSFCSQPYGSGPCQAGIVPPT